MRSQIFNLIKDQSTLSWEQIAATMSYDIRWLHRLHGRALDEVQALLDKSA